MLKKRPFFLLWILVLVGGSASTTAKIQELGFFDSLYWHKQAAQRGNIWAQYELANRYRYGNGIRQDFVLAYHLYNVAALSVCEPALDGLEQITLKMTPEQIAQAHERTINYLEGRKPLL